MTFTVLSSSLVSTAQAPQWTLSFGANDLILKGARPLQAAPDGGTSHALMEKAAEGNRQSV